VPVLGLAVAAELAAQIWAPPIALVPAGPLGWTMQPGLRNHRVDQAEPQLDFSVSTNQDGLRTTLPRAPNRRRAVTVGESTIFGWGLPADQAPAAFLDEQLGSDWEVVNAGQPGYSSEQARRLVQSLAPLYQPDLVIWFHPWNDLAPARATDRDLLPVPDAERPAWQASRLMSWLASPADGVGLALQDNPLMPLRYDGPGETLRVTPGQRAENLAAVAATVGPERLLIVLLPNDATAAQGGLSPLALELAGIAAELGVAWLDLTGSLSINDLDALTLPGDPGHFNATGNQRLMIPVTQAVTEGFAKPL
jgi:lysophospholipase L1-like esterase